MKKKFIHRMDQEQVFPNFTFKPIGFIKSCYTDKFGTPRQPHLAPSSWAILELERWVQPELSLQDIEGFSHLWVIFVFHQNSGSFSKPKVHPPRLGGKSTGVFASRSPHRYNPIGLSVVKIDRVEGRKIYLKGVDLVDGTPVLDIKPYIPSSDAHPEAKSSWVEEKLGEPLNVTFAEAAESKLSSKPLSNRPYFRDLIIETIRLDPRALPYKGTSDKPQPYGSRYGFNLEHLNVIFEVQETHAHVLDIEKHHKGKN